MAVNNSIISNFIANSTIGNASKAQNDIATAASRMSSGSRITKPSDDVAGLIVSKFMEGQMVQISASLKNIGQADSMLQTTSDFLDQLQSIYNRQKDLGTQAKSSSLPTDIKGKYQQELMELAKEANRIAKEANFNNIKLLDGSQYAPNKVTTDTYVDSANVKSATEAKGNLTISNALVAGADNDSYLELNGARLYFRATTGMGSGVPALNIDITQNSTAATQTSAIYNKIQEVLKYDGDNLALQRAREKWSELSFEYPGKGGSDNTTISISSKTAGAAGNSIQIGTSNITTATAVTLDGATLDNNISNLTSSSRTSSTVAQNGSLNGGVANTIRAAGTLNITTAFAVGDNGSSISINGATFNLNDTATFGALSATQQMYAMDVQAGATTASAQIETLMKKIDAIVGYEGTDATVLGMKDKLKDLDFIASGGSLKITSRLDGTAGNTIKIAGSAFTTGVANLDGYDIESANLDLATTYRGTFYDANEVKLAKTEGFKASGTLTIGTAYNGAGDANKEIEINGAVFIMKNAASGAINEISYTANTTAATQAAALAKAIQDVKDYTGTDATLLSYKDKLKDIAVAYDGSSSTIKISSKLGGTDGNNITMGRNSAVGTGAVLINGAAQSGNTPVALANGIGGHYTKDISRTTITGQITNSVLTDLDTDSPATSGVDASGISNNADFVGTISGFKASKTAGKDNNVSLELTVGGITYKASNINTKPGSDTTITLAAEGEKGGFFKIRLNSDVSTSILDDSDASKFADKINKAFEGLSFSQNRDVSSYDAAAGGLIKDGTNTVGDLEGTSWKLLNSSFSSVQVEKVSITAPQVGDTDAKLSITLNGEAYTSDAGIGSIIAAKDTITLRNGQKSLQFTNGATALDLSSDSKAEAVQNAFMKAFGVNNGGSSMVFQVGTAATDIIEIKLKSMLSDDAYGQDYTKLDITSLEGAEKALSAINNAIDLLNENLGTVGAAQSRFSYAAANLEALQQNMDAARGTFADADLAAESVSLANSTVRYNASLSVLAQVNQLGQSLLKVIG